MTAPEGSWTAPPTSAVCAYTARGHRQRNSESRRKGFMASLFGSVDSDWLGTLKSVEGAICSENSFEYFVNEVAHLDSSSAPAGDRGSGRSRARRNQVQPALDWW